MLTFKNNNIVFILLLMLAIILHLTIGISIWMYVVLLFIYSFILFYGCVYIQSNFFIRTICAANTSEKKIALSFDDGPTTSYTPEILQTLKQQNVEAAFFCIGNRIKGNELLLKQIIEEGHIVGNHSYSHHFWFDLFSAKKILKDLQSMDAEMKAITGLLPKLFRPPYGVINPNVKNAIIKGNYISIGWSVRSMDTVTTDKEKLLDKIISGLHPGAIYLFHDTNITTAAVLSEFIQFVKENGYQIVRLDKMLNLSAYA